MLPVYEDSFAQRVLPFCRGFWRTINWLRTLFYDLMSMSSPMRERYINACQNSLPLAPRSCFAKRTLDSLEINVSCIDAYWQMDYLRMLHNILQCPRHRCRCGGQNREPIGTSPSADHPSPSMHMPMSVIFDALLSYVKMQIRAQIDTQSCVI